MAFSRGPSIVTDGLVLYLDAANHKSYPGSGTVWRDLSGNNNSGSLVNGPTFDSGNGGSIVFDGTNDYCDIGSPISGTGQMSLEFWINPNTISNDDRIISNTNGTNFSIRYNSDLHLQVWGSSWKTLFSTPDDLNNWTHYIIVFLGSNQITAYRNGIQGNTITTTYNVSNSGLGTLRFAYPLDGQYGNYFDGKIALGKAYSKMLSPSEVLENYNATKSRFNL